MTNPSDQQDVEKAVQRTLAGEENAFEEVIRAFQGDVSRMVASLLYDRDSTQDIVQECFVKAYSRLKSYRPGTSLRAWLLTVARNTALNEIRAHGRKNRHLDGYREEYLAQAETNDSESDSASPRLDALRHCRETLPERFQGLLTMRYTEQMEMEAIARKIGRSIEAVRQSFWRLRGVLRDCIEKRMVQA